ncbi:Hypothetical protein POVN_LOCUS695 [uncultured virus]|nr:Hypothetical protein POVN_LOCUS695 [uncultured virus]
MTAALQSKVEIDCIAKVLEELKQFYNMHDAKEAAMVRNFLLSNEVSDAEREAIFHTKYATADIHDIVDRYHLGYNYRNRLSPEAMRMIGARQNLELVGYTAPSSSLLGAVLQRMYRDQSFEVIAEKAQAVKETVNSSYYPNFKLVEGKIRTWEGDLPKVRAIQTLLEFPISTYLQNTAKRDEKQVKAASGLALWQAHRIILARQLLGVDAKTSQEWLLDTFAEGPPEYSYRQLDQSGKLDLMYMAGIRNIFPGNLPPADALKVLENVGPYPLADAILAIPGLMVRLYTHAMERMTPAQLATYKTSLIKAGLNLKACTEEALAAVMEETLHLIAGTNEETGVDQLPLALQNLIAGLY